MARIMTDAEFEKLIGKLGLYQRRKVVECFWRETIHSASLRSSTLRRTIASATTTMMPTARVGIGG